MRFQPRSTRAQNCRLPNGLMFHCGVCCRYEMLPTMTLAGKRGSSLPVPSTLRTRPQRPLWSSSSFLCGASWSNQTTPACDVFCVRRSAALARDCAILALLLRAATLAACTSPHNTWPGGGSPPPGRLPQPARAPRPRFPPSRKSEIRLHSTMSLPIFNKKHPIFQ